MPLQREDVVAAYRYILGREPESDAVVDGYLAHCGDIASLREIFLASDEFVAGRQRRSEFAEPLARGYWSRPRRIETEVADPVLAALTARIRRQWTRLGEEQPYWSVLTDERYRPDRIDDATLAAFRETGRQTASLLDGAKRRGLPSVVGGTCVELGCGVGRVTRHLADRFERVIALDISPGNLKLCEEYMAIDGIRNVETRLLRNLDDLEAIGPLDWFFSVIVLQHNSPPIQHRILSALLPQIGAGGGFVFQTISDLPGYGFVAERYLASDEDVMELHALPQAAIFKLLGAAGLSLAAARMDPWIDAYGSYTYEGFRA